MKKNLNNKILEILYRHDGEYVNLYSYLSKETLDKERIQKAIQDLHEYIELESIYEHRGIRSLSDNIIDEESDYKQKARINQKGREKYEHILDKKKDRQLSWKIALISIFVSAVVSILITYVVPLIMQNINSKSEVIPNITLVIDNKTEEDLQAWHYQEFFLWFPGDSGYIIGKYEIVNCESNDVVNLPVGQTVLEIKILNNNYYKYYLAEECSISTMIRTTDGELYSSDKPLPLNLNTVEKYALLITISD